MSQSEKSGALHDLQLSDCITSTRMYQLDAMHSQVMCRKVFICLSQYGIVSKRLDVS